MIKTLVVVLLALATAVAQSTPAAKSETKAASKSDAAADHKPSPIADNPAYEKLKSMAGNWEGTMQGYDGPVTASFRVISKGSAVVLTQGEGTEHEMITVFHPDGKTLMATHYCAARNQPRMRLTDASNPNVLRFNFVDVTNVPDTNTGHMHSLVITTVADGHQYQDWTWTQAGKQGTTRFDMKRK